MGLKDSSCIRVSSSRTNLSITLAITCKKIFGFMLIKGGIKATTFGSFLNELLKAYPEILEEKNKYFFFLDNASIHKSKALEVLKHKLRICILQAISDTQ